MKKFFLIVIIADFVTFTPFRGRRNLNVSIDLLLLSSSCWGGALGEGQSGRYLLR